ncbi:homoserine kinase [Alkalimarinus coralli]|uniref:homoserine kinase n=1 Tax=Alkalimarinus coralli TaxID=2935863 RepID=UPI00202B7D7A|nr:homoserine kinase [Alkalimarinus coralli]
MAVYTSVNRSELSDFLLQYSLGELVEFSEIGDGIENSNYFVTLAPQNEERVGRDAGNGQHQKWVLTLFENLKAQELPFFLQLMTWLAEKGFPVPAPCVRKDGTLNGTLRGKPSILVPCFNGRSLDNPAPAHCERVGKLIAEMHQALIHCPQQRSAPRNIDWMRSQASRLSGLIPQSDMKLLRSAIDHYGTMKPEMEQCPSGVIHADLFKDNVLFDGDEISGVIDFFHACNDSLLFDLAVAANDWAVDGKQQYDKLRLNALVTGYQSVRPWSDSECSLWPSFLHLAALRFWLSRLESRYMPGYQKVSTQGDKTKEPDELKRIILNLGLVATK